MELNMQNFSKAGFDVFSMFSDRWALVTAGSMEDFNTMTIGWGCMGSIWGAPGKCRQIIQVFVRDNRRTADYMLDSDYFTVSFFPEQYRKELLTLGSVSGHDKPDKIKLSSLRPRAMGCSVGFEQAELSFLCKKLYCRQLDRDAIPEDILQRMYSADEHMHYAFIGEICAVEGSI